MSLKNKAVSHWRFDMIAKFILYFFAFAFDIFEVNFFVDPVVGTLFFTIFGEHEGAWSVIRIVFLMGILLAACLIVNYRDSTILDLWDSEIAACKKEGTKIDTPKPSDFKAYLAENFAFTALGVFMLAYISPAILIHGELWYFIPAFFIIAAVVTVFIYLNRDIAQKKLNALMDLRFGENEKT